MSALRIAFCMLVCLLVAIVAVLLLDASAAGAETLLTPSGAPMGQPFVGWVGGMKVPTSPAPITVTLEDGSKLADDCGTKLSAACTDGRNIYLSTRDGIYAEQQYLRHELGHDFELNLPQDQRDSLRAAWERIWSFHRGWWAAFGKDGRSPGEWFAESYRLCSDALSGIPGENTPGYFAVYGFPGLDSPVRMRETCALIRSVHPGSPPLYVEIDEAHR